MPDQQAESRERVRVFVRWLRAWHNPILSGFAYAPVSETREGQDEPPRSSARCEGSGWGERTGSHAGQATEVYHAVVPRPGDVSTVVDRIDALYALGQRRINAIQRIDRMMIAMFTRSAIRPSDVGLSSGWGDSLTRFRWRLDRTRKASPPARTTDPTHNSRTSRSREGGSSAPRSIAVRSWPNPPRSETPP